ADGVQFRAADARAYTADGRSRDMADTLDAMITLNHSTRPLALDIQNAPSRKRSFIGLSAHTAEELGLAKLLGADFVVLGHVLDTPSHPGRKGVGWERFAQLAGGA